MRYPPGPPVISTRADNPLVSTWTRQSYRRRSTRATPGERPTSAATKWAARSGSALHDDVRAGPVIGQTLRASTPLSPQEAALCGELRLVGPRSLRPVTANTVTATRDAAVTKPASLRVDRRVRTCRCAARQTASAPRGVPS